AICCRPQGSSSKARVGTSPTTDAKSRSPIRKKQKKQKTLRKRKTLPRMATRKPAAAAKPAKNPAKQTAPPSPAAKKSKYLRAEQIFTRLQAAYPDAKCALD